MSGYRHHCAPMPPQQAKAAAVALRCLRPYLGDGQWAGASPISAWVIKFEFLVGFAQRQQFQQRVERQFQQRQCQQQQPQQQQRGSVGARRRVMRRVP